MTQNIRELEFEFGIHLADLKPHDKDKVLEITSRLLFEKDTHLNTTLKEIEEEVEKLKRTDDTQMSEDHIYDEALDDIKQLIHQKLIK